MIKPLLFFTFVCVSINLNAQQGITETIKLYEEGLSKYSELEDFDGAIIDFKAVIIDFTKAIELNQEVAVAFDYRGRAKYYIDDEKGAIIDFNKAIELDPGVAATHEYRGRAKLYLADEKGAIIDFNKAIELDPEVAVTYEYRGRAKLYLNDEKGAIVDFTKAIEFDPKNADAYDYRGLAKYYLDDEKGSINDFNKAIELEPEVADFYGNRGMAKYSIDDYEGAIVDFNKAIELDPGVANYLSNRGLAKYSIDDNEGAIVDFNKAIELDPEFAIVYGNRAMAKGSLDNKDGSMADYNKAIELNPKFADAFNNRALLKVDIKDYEGAITDFNRAIAIDSLSPLYFKNLGETLEKIKKFKDAKIQFINAAKLDPSGNITKYNTQGYYYPNVVVGENDEIKFPIEVDIELFVEDIFNFDTKNDQFFLRFNYAMYSSISANYMTENNDTINQITDLRKTVKVDYVKSDQTQINQLTFDPFYDDIVGYSYQGSLESSFYHNWDLSEYPFDKQNVQVRFKSSLDSTIFKFNESMRFPASFNKKMIGLKEGFKIDTITFHNSYTNGWYELDLSPTLTRNIIYPIGVFDIIISRKSFWLFIKLFLGSILSFLISWIVFLIPKKQFESRISLTVGGIFGAIGNRYFVDSTIPSVQYLTKADMINNLILLLLILNIFIVIIQENDKINFGLLEQNKFAMIFTGIAFVVLNTLIVLW